MDISIVIPLAQSANCGCCNQIFNLILTSFLLHKRGFLQNFVLLQT